MVRAAQAMTEMDGNGARAGSTPVVPGYSRLVQIGRGGFASVYRAHEEAFGRDVAIKVLDVGDVSEDARRRFERECKAVGALSSHPNIVTVFSAGSTAEGNPYIVMELMEKGSLTKRLSDDGPIPAAEVVQIGRGLLSAIGAAHDIGILHRDIKPDNVLVSRHGNHGLADFGISSIPGGYETRSGTVTATIAFAAPEVINGDRATASSDLYSLAATLATLIIGAPVFQRRPEENLLAFIYRILREQPRDLTQAGASPDLAAVLSKAMAKEPADRFPDAASFAAALNGVPETGLEVAGGSRQASSAHDVVPAADGADVATPAADPRPQRSTPASPLEEATVARAAAIPPLEALTVKRAHPGKPTDPAESAAGATTDSVTARSEGPEDDLQRGRRRNGRKFALIALAACVVLGAGGSVAYAAWAGGNGAPRAQSPVVAPSLSPSPTPTPSRTSVVAEQIVIPRVQHRCVGRTCSFSVVKPPPRQAGETFTWQFGDGAEPAAGVRTSHRYPRAGSFSAHLVVGHGADSMRSQAIPIRIETLRERARLTAGGPGSLILTATVKGPRKCLPAAYSLQRRTGKWAPVDSGRLKKEITRLRVHNPGAYRMILGQSSVAGGICATTRTSTVQVRPAPHPTHVAPPPVYSSPAPVYTPPTQVYTPPPATHSNPPPTHYSPPPVTYTPPPPPPGG